MTPRARTEQVLQDAAIQIDDADRLLEVSVAAKRLNRCREQVRRYIREGRLRAIRVRPGDPRSRGGNYLISESAIRDFLTTTQDILLHAATSSPADRA